MAYDPQNPPALTPSGTLHGRNKRWSYRSTDNAAAVNTAGYFTNGYSLGMRAGDVVEVTDTDDNTVTLMTVNAASAASGVDVSDGTIIATTDTD